MHRLANPLMATILLVALGFGFMFVVNRAKCVQIEGTRKYVCAFDLDFSSSGGR